MSRNPTNNQTTTVPPHSAVSSPFFEPARPARIPEMRDTVAWDEVAPAVMLLCQGRDYPDLQPIGITLWLNVLQFLMETAIVRAANDR
ncbi:uncharacterized protein RHO25_008201 [Cercospora beticola]|uniref:Uncharacterized protein n=1 Tax=Cercospora beticola TaxID=122368 RepID=A0ABZ0NVP4_CERBT|nr:hypothetical protein RHO25_008201 [Cercospora beticola]